MLRIADIICHVLECEIEEPFGCAKYWFNKRTAMLLEIHTDTGIIGIGECNGPPQPSKTIIESFFKPLVIGEDPLNVEKIWEKLYHHSRDYGQRGMPIAAISGIDIALWDIIGKALNQPIYKLIGGGFRDKIRPYATGLYYYKGNEKEKLQEEAKRYVREGFKYLKLKIGKGIQEDIERVKWIKEAVGDKIFVMVDANHAYTASTAIRLGRILEEYDIYWFEEPVIPEDIEGYKEVKAAVNIPIAGGETVFTRFGFKDLISNRAVDIAQPCISAAGGITECKKIATICNTWNIPCIPHIWGTNIALAAALHFLAALPHTPPSIYPIEPLMEFDRTIHPIREQSTKKPIKIDSGFVLVPQEPGLGVELNRDIISKYSV